MKSLLAAAVILAALLGALMLLRPRLRRRDAGVLLELLPPEGIKPDPASWTLFFQALYAIAHPWWKRWLWGQPWICLELESLGGRLAARCWTPSALERMVTVQLRSAVPGLEARQAVPTAEPDAARCARSRLGLDGDPLNPLAPADPERLGRVLRTLGATKHGVIQLAISPDVGWQRRALRELDRRAGLAPERGPVGSLAGWLLDSAFHLVLPPATEPAAPRPRPSRPAPPADKALRAGWAAELRLRVCAPTAEEAAGGIHSLVGAFRSFDGAIGLRPHRVWNGRHFDAAMTGRRPPGQRAMTLIAEELAGLFHLPAAGGVFDVAPARLAPGAPLSEQGKVICLADDGAETPATLSPRDARHHVHVLGPTGAGKSTLLLNLALDDIRAGHGVAVIDPKGDLVRDLLERMPAQVSDRVVLLDPSLRERPVGLNVLECLDPELDEVVCDQVVAIFKKTYDRFWGPRTDDILRGALLTLLRRPGSTLCEVPLLLLHPEVRERYIEGLRDPIGLEAFWEEFGQLPDGQRLQMIGPLLNKLRAFLLRRTVRNVLGQSRSTIDLPQVLDGGGVLLVSLAKGLLGEETSKLLGAFLFTRIWQAAMARAASPESERRDFTLYLDEFQNYLHLPQSLDEVLVEARGYHLGLVLANQHLGQLAPSTREALAANARTRVVFQAGQDDARSLAREFQPWLDDWHLRNLSGFQVAVRLCRDGRSERPFTGMTRPAPTSLGSDHAVRMRDAALARAGRQRDAVEAEIIDHLRQRGFRMAEGDPVD